MCRASTAWKRRFYVNVGKATVVRIFEYLGGGGAV
jgi:hypothetical protein